MRCLHMHGDQSLRKKRRRNEQVLPRSRESPVQKVNSPRLHCSMCNHCLSEWTQFQKCPGRNVISSHVFRVQGEWKVTEKPQVLRLQVHLISRVKTGLGLHSSAKKVSAASVEEKGITNYTPSRRTRREILCPRQDRRPLSTCERLCPRKGRLPACFRDI